MIRIVAVALIAAIIVIALALAARAQQPYLYILPPVEFDHPYTGQLLIEIVDTTSQVQSLCFITSPRVACSFASPTWCRIVIVKDEVMRAMGWNPLHIWRHEHGHCNGWSPDNKHVGARPAIQANDLNWKHDPRALYKSRPKAETTAFDKRSTGTPP